MAKHKRLILKCNIEKAKRKHFCKHSKNHSIQSGESRLTITLQDGRGTLQHYCRECALKMIEQTFGELNTLKAQLESI